MKKTTIATLGLLGLGLSLGLGAKAHADEIQENGQTYWQVESGDTLSAIGNRYGIDFNLIHQANSDKVSDANLIYVGDKLLLPLNGEVQAPVSQPVQETPVVEQAPVVEETPVVEQAPVVQEPVVQEPVVQEPVEQAPAVTSNSAKEWIAQKESGGSYSATNGRYIGRYQLDSSYLNGDYSPENQERVADAYVAGRYGSWENAQAFWLANGWY
ncbi:Aggregation promoting factor [Enterococcus phage 163]|uniref:Aggregation promoting factor n=1 Tax=Enterococcus phage 163 TaxID=2699794 RepID=A0ACA9ASL1_9CAUD|nr:Aggregation promoting factor [Enterococcus phage 163]